MRKIKIKLGRQEYKELLHFIEGAMNLMEDPAGRSIEFLFACEVFGKLLSRMHCQLFSCSRNEVVLSLNMTESYVLFTVITRFDVADTYRDMILRKIIMEIDKATI